MKKPKNKKSTRLPRRMVVIPGVGRVPTDDLVMAQAAVGKVMVRFGRLLDHVLGTKEIPEHELRDFFK